MGVFEIAGSTTGRAKLIGFPVLYLEESPCQLFLTNHQPPKCTPRSPTLVSLPSGTKTVRASEKQALNLPYL